MAAPSLPRPARKSTKPTRPEKPKEVLYEDKVRSGDVLDVPLKSLCPNPFNKRQMKGIPELAATIGDVGLLQDIAHIRRDVWLKHYPETRERITADNVILFGEHRWRAVELLGWETIPSELSDNRVEDARLITLIENLRRAQLSPLEEAQHYQELREQDNLTYEQIAAKVGETAKGSLSKGTVWKRVRLLKLDPVAQEALGNGELAVSAAEKILTLDSAEDRSEAFQLIRQGAHPAEAHAQVLTRQREAPDIRNPDRGGDNDASPQTQPVSTGNDKPNGDEKSPPAQRSASKRTEKKPDADQYEQDRRAAAADRDAACQHLLEKIDISSPDSAGILLQALTAAALSPPQQGPAQQRALAWLRRINRQQLAESHAGPYFSAVVESGNESLQRLAAFASALAAGELRTSARRQSWGAREIAHVRFLQQHAGYVPETAWERRELGLDSVGAH
ncbi:ParB/RepB/Spo0J family partition protein [Streptomyces sp. NPDC058595]|uniref:ParB/RepB/Spo0J family partition protein n=1 Tax=Streptomyces sp. NPDC058595 TaxID=3346550 RepID=UPI00364F02FC